ncbi:SRPBCC family protein [Arthrobacter sp. PAMC25564]|uniref:SRPBCC family protein n=1 Tax=Arthrobacter sp. PAMC25564 TaxID=2565366 RepID=UPI0010A264C9|nr:SRPBCC family protein [Arthrobacter sp. PAMC25564]QCB96513.1 SRPBCC family protein [Arthrobacter sp. PAMC25564]
MDHKTSLTQHIKAPADKVWAVISDIPGSAATLSGVDSIQMLTQGPYGEGTRWKESRTMMGRSETVEMWVTQCEPPVPAHGGSAGGGARGGSTTVKALQGGADYTSRFALAERDGGTDLTLTFGAELVNPTRLSKIMMAMFGPIGMRITRKALAKDLAEIAAKAESL